MTTTSTAFQEITEKNAHFYREIAEFYVYRPNVRPYATGSSSEKSRHFSEPAVFVAKVAKRQNNQLTFCCNRQQAHENIQNNKNNRSVGKRKTYTFRNIFLFWNISKRTRPKCFTRKTHNILLFYRSQVKEQSLLKILFI